jgi:uncharacterized cupin superfamily protein
METRLLHVSQVPISTPPTRKIKPERFVGTHESRLGEIAGITQFGVNLVTLEPDSMTALRHWHEGKDEFVYVLKGKLTLIDNNGEHPLEEGFFAGFPAGIPNAHHLVNNSAEAATVIVVGSRRPGQDTIYYPDDDLGPIHK